MSYAKNLEGSNRIENHLLYCTYGVTTHINGVAYLDYDSASGLFRCPYCMRSYSLSLMTVDHVLSKYIFRHYCRNGVYTVNDIRNKVASCSYCNMRKDSNLYVPLAESSPLNHMGKQWMIEYADYFYGAFMNGRIVRGYPYYFSVSDVSKDIWDRFLNKYRMELEEHA